MNREISNLREVVQKLVPLLAGKGLIVTQRGSRAYVQCNVATRKPESVNIPNIGEDAQPDFIRAIQGFIDHEIGHVLITDWNYYGGDPAPSQEDLAKPRVQMLLNCHNIVEDTMIEREIIKIFPGAKRNISDTRKYFLEKITKVAINGTKDPEEKLRYLVVPLMRALAGHKEMIEFMDAGKYWEFPAIAEVVKRLSPATLELLKTATTTKETLVMAKELMQILHGDEKKAPPKSEDKPDKKADEGDGDGERDHSESEPGEADEDDKAEAGKEETGKDKAEEDEDDGDQPDGPEKDADAEAPDAAEDEDDAEEGKDADPDADGDEDEDAGDDAHEPPEADRPDNAGDEPDDEEPEDTDAAAEADDGDAAEGDDAADAGDPGDDTDDEEPEGEDADTDATGTAGGDTESDGDDDAGEQSGDDASSVGGQRDDAETPADFEGDEGDEDEDGGDGGGVGSAEGKSMFDYDDADALEGADMSSQISQMLSHDAVEAMDRSSWRVFSREWDRIEPLEVPEDMNRKWVPNLEDAVRAMTGRMQKDIERIMASQSYVIRTPGHKNGKLHSPSLFRVMQDDPRVFSQKQEHTSKDTAVMLLVDNSGSMHGEKMRLAMIAAYALANTLERVNIANEVIGFTTGGYGDTPESYLQAMREEYDSTKGSVSWDRNIPLVMPIYKSYAEKINATVKRRVAYALNAQKGLNGNIDGESVLIAAERIAKRPEKRKVMIVLSDGQPAAGRRGNGHLKETVKYINKSGIECIGIGILDDAVRDYYDKYVVLRKAEELPLQVMTEIKKLLM